LIKQLSLNSGYDSAAIRERIYDDDSRGQAGILLFTGSNDADGTLGGLQAIGRSKNLFETLIESLKSSQWCVSDPLCSHGDLAIAESYSIASCHGCVMLPETSCETFNHFLDRGLLIGTPEEPSIGYFCEVPGWQ
jgi:hypothetical protein